MNGKTLVKMNRTIMQIKNYFLTGHKILSACLVNSVLPKSSSAKQKLAVS